MGGYNARLGTELPSVQAGREPAPDCVAPAGACHLLLHYLPDLGAKLGGFFYALLFLEELSPQAPAEAAGKTILARG